MGSPRRSDQDGAKRQGRRPAPSTAKGSAKAARTESPQKTPASSSRSTQRPTAVDGDGKPGEQTPNASNADILEAVISSREEIITTTTESGQEVLEAVRRRLEPTHEEIADLDLREVVEQLDKNTREIILEAVNDAHVNLKLDDLFIAVTSLTPKARRIKAVDIEIHRWMDDERAREYLGQNKAALEQGTEIKRVFVISPRVVVGMMDKIEEILIEHLNLTELPAVKEARGHLEIGVIHHSDLPRRSRPRDFAVFGGLGEATELRGDKVLFETFNPEWTSTFKGQLTMDKKEIQTHTNYFETVWKRSERLMSPGDVTNWAEKMRDRIAGSEFEYDLFFGYSERAETTAEKIMKFISNNGYTVFDWKEHFEEGGNLLDQIKRARDECRLGLFLFTGDDVPEDGDPTPRDNVIFESGYFMSAKAEKQVVAILEDGVKLLSDLEGQLLIPLANRLDVRTIETRLRNWLVEHLGARQQKRRRSKR